MASKNYNLYNYPYKQSSAQQYPTYQAAPAPNNVPQPSRQYQQPPTTQGNDYMSYQGPSCGAQSSGYTGSAQDNSWNGSSYGGNRETTRGAAAVLGNVSNTDYTPNSTGATQSSFTPANNATSQATRYSSGNSNSPRMQPQQTHAAHATQSSYGQSQARPRSVNTNRAQQPVSRGLPSPATGAGYPSQTTLPSRLHLRETPQRRLLFLNNTLITTVDNWPVWKHHVPIKQWHRPRPTIMAAP
jgi:hypothetical protein